MIPKSITPDRIASNIDVFKFELTDDDMAAIAKLDAGRRLIKGYPFMGEGVTDWRQLWDDDTEHAAAGAATAAAGTAAAATA